MRYALILLLTLLSGCMSKWQEPHQPHTHAACGAQFVSNKVWDGPFALMPLIDCMSTADDE